MKKMLYIAFLVIFIFFSIGCVAAGDNITKIDKTVKKASNTDYTVNSYDDLRNNLNSLNSTTDSATFNVRKNTYSINANISVNASKTRNITINGNNATLNANRLCDFITIGKGYTVYMSNLTITACNGSSACVINNKGTLYLSDCVITNCTSENGAIFNTGNIFVDKCSVNDNFASLKSAVFYNTGNLTVKDSSFTSNVGNRGGVFENNGVLLLNNSNFTSNGGNFAGVVFNKASLNASANRFTDNRVDVYGGVVYDAGNSTFKSNTFSGSYAGKGGCTYNEGDETFINNTFTGNMAINGAVFSNRKNLYAVNNTIKFNDNDEYNFATILSNIDNASLVNNTIVNNTGGCGVVTYNQGLLYLTGNLIANNTAYQNGSILNNGTLYVSGNRITGNSANLGGVVYNNNTCNIFNNTINNNNASHGAVLFNTNNGEANITGNNISRNNVTRYRPLYADSVLGRGAVVYMDNGVVKIDKNNITQNTAEDEAAIAFTIDQAQKLEITNNNITKNRATYGTTLYSQNITNATIKNNNIKENYAYQATLSYTWSKSNVTITHNNITQNQATEAGLTYNFANTTIAYNNIRNNTAEHAGIILNSFEGNLKLYNNNITKNHAEAVGLIVNYDRMTINNNNITQNYAQYLAGIIHNMAYMNITSNKFTQNYITTPQQYIIYNQNEGFDNKMILAYNTFNKNTYNHKDILLYNDANLTVNQNTYNNNSLYNSTPKTVANTYLNRGQNMTINLEIDSRSIYKDTQKTGHIILVSNNKEIGRYNITNAKANITITNQQVAGYNNITLLYQSQDKYYNDIILQFKITAYKNTQITLTPVKSMIGKQVNITAKVTDTTNNNISDGYVIYKFNGVTYKDSKGNQVHVNVKNGQATLTMTTPSTWKNATNTIEVVYSGITNIYNQTRATTTFQITRTANMTLTPNVYTTKMDHTITLSIRIQDNNRIINSGKAVFKINGVTIKDKNNKTIQVYVKNNTAQINFTIPDGWSAKKVKITAVYSNKEYERIEATNYFNITKTQPHYKVNIKLKNNQITITGQLLDEYNHTLKGTNALGVKINGITLKKPNGANQYFQVDNGTIQVNHTLTNNYTKGSYIIELVTGERNAYLSLRTNYKIKVSQ